VSLARAIDLVLAVEGSDGGDRREGFLAHDQRLVRDVGENDRLRKSGPGMARSGVSRLAPRASASAICASALRLARRVHQRPDLDTVLQA
jgi:hypothetical protein